MAQLLYPQYFDVIFKELGQQYIEDDETLTHIGSLSFACNSVMRLLTGFILDFVSAKKANYVIITLMMLHILTLHIAVQHWRLYMISSMVIMGCEGAYTSLQAVLIMQ